MESWLFIQENTRGRNRTFVKYVTRNSEEEAHMAGHDDIGRFACDKCDYAAKWKSNLTSHLKTHH